jgi:hypothetical protein
VERNTDMAVPHSEQDAIMDQTHESYKTNHSADSCAQLSWEAYITGQSSSSEAGELQKSVVPEVEFPESPSYYLEPPAPIIPDTIRHLSSSSSSSWVHDNDSSVTSLSHESSSSVCSSFYLTQVADTKMEDTETGALPLRDISTMVDCGPWYPGKRALIMKEEFIGKADSPDPSGIVSDGMLNMNILDLQDSNTAESKRMERTQSMCHTPLTNVDLSQNWPTEYQRPLAMKSPKLDAMGLDWNYLEQYHLSLQSPNFNRTPPKPPIDLSILSQKINLRTRRRGRCRRTQEQSIHLEPWLETHGTAPGKEIQSILASESGALSLWG